MENLGNFLPDAIVIINKTIDAKETLNNAIVMGPKLMSANLAPMKEPPQIAPRQINAIQLPNVGFVIFSDLA